MKSPVFVTIAVEGDTDVVVVEKILTLTNHHAAYIYGRKGKGRLDQQILGFNNAARTAPWLVLRDLDTDAPCAGDLVKTLLPTPSTRMRFRIAVHALEAWLLADADSISRYFAVSRDLVPADPESLPHPKRALIDLARRSRLATVRDDMVPRTGTTAKIGPGYTDRVSEFTRDHWRPRVAAKHAQSLRRCIAALRTLR